MVDVPDEVDMAYYYSMCHPLHLYPGKGLTTTVIVAGQMVLIFPSVEICQCQQSPIKFPLVQPSAQPRQRTKSNGSQSHEPNTSKANRRNPGSGVDLWLIEIKSAVRGEKRIVWKKFSDFEILSAGEAKDFVGRGLVSLIMQP